jgi:hypothetical protein
MTPEQIIAKIDESYGDGWQLGQYAADPHGNHGDPLAAFIVLEIRETHDPSQTDAEQLETARRAIETAIADLSGVYDRLGELGEKVTS